MEKIQITYNPYTVKTEIFIKGEKVDLNTSRLSYTENKRLQEWMEPSSQSSLSYHNDIFTAFKDETGDSEIEIEFTGTSMDFDDLKYAQKQYGSCFNQVILHHVNEEEADKINPDQKLEQLKKLYEELQNGPIEEVKEESIKRKFESAINSDFRIVIVAPMSSGKSTLLNAIIGKDLLPVANEATTAVTTEIRDSDDMEDFIVSATDRNGKLVADKEPATPARIKELNEMKSADNEDVSEIKTIRLEGNVPHIPSDTLHTVFVDTPGGNNAQNNEHEKTMDEAIKDEDKSLILYVFNGTQLSTNDSNQILSKISTAMKNSINGKLSRDRFLFVANKMDTFDTEKEHFEHAIDAIRSMLGDKGINDPALFLTSAQVAKLIRMYKDKQSFTKKEKKDLYRSVDDFNDEDFNLTKYASLDRRNRDRLLEEKNACMQSAQNAAADEEEAYKLRVAELNSGVPALERAITTYLKKYAVAIKIKTAHDAFMNKVNELKMIEKCEAEWAESVEKLEEIQNELNRKREEYKKNNKLGEFKKKVDKIHLNKDEIKEKRLKIVSEITKLSELSKNVTDEEYTEDEANEILEDITKKLKKIGKNAKDTLNKALNEEIQASCKKIVNEYEQYISETYKKGLFNIGDYDVTKTTMFLEIEDPERLLEDYTYTTTEKERGFFGGLKRVFTFGKRGWTTRTVVDLKELILNEISPISDQVDNEITRAQEEAEKKVDDIKNETKKKLDGIDSTIQELHKTIEQIVKDRKALEKRVDENKEKREWLNDFVNRVENLLAI